MKEPLWQNCTERKNRETAQKDNEEPVSEPLVLLPFSFEASHRPHLFTSWLMLTGVIAQVCGALWEALVLSGCESRPGTGSLHLVAIKAATEETKSSEPLV